MLPIDYSIFDDMIEGVQVIGPSMEYVYVNKAVALQAKKNQAELLNKKMNEVFFGIEKTSLWQNIKEVQNTQQPLQYINEFEFPDKSKGYFDLRFQSHLNNVIIFSFDITDQKRAEEILKKESEQNKFNFELLVKNSPSGIMVIDHQQKIQISNNEACAIFGYEKNELLYKDLNLLVPINVVDIHKSLFEEYIKNPHTIKMSAERQVIGLTKEGQHIDIQVGLTPIKMNGQNQILASVIDISHLKKLERNLVASNIELDSFSHRVAHDVVAPLRGISELSSFALEDIEQNDIVSVVKFLKKIKTTSDNLKELTNDLLALSRVKKNDDITEEIDFNSLIQSALNNLNTLISKNKIQLTQELNIHTTFNSIRVRIQQIIENLVSNAVKYSDSSKPNSYVKIEISQSENLKNLIIRVADNGIGIPKDFQHKIFELFYRAHPKVSFGTGLGSYLIKQHVEFLGGHIQFESSELGTSFEVTLPFQKTKSEN